MFEGGRRKNRPPFTAHEAVLTVFESDVITVVRRRRRAGAAEVRADLEAAGYTAPYTTVASALQRLHRRGILTRANERVRGGQRYVFQLAEDHPAVIANMLGHLTDAFGGVSDGPAREAPPQPGDGQAGEPGSASR